jgi:Transaldolase/Fructose-6-phosphate aldolase
MAKLPTVKNPLKQLLPLGQSVWLDYIRRDLISTGELARLIEQDGLRGMTSNPTIFEKAIAHSHDYVPALQEPPLPIPSRTLSLPLSKKRASPLCASTCPKSTTSDWEIATAIAGSVIGINAFNQPDVEASKIKTRKLAEQYEKSGSLPSESPFFQGSGVKLFTDEKNASALKQSAAPNPNLVAYLRAHLGRLHAGDYFAVLGYVEMNESNESQLQSIRHAVRDKKRVAPCLGFGLRFLHSTGQAYKGRPNSGVFLQITSEHATDLPVPGQKHTFGIVKAAQARGDFQVLAERNRRALRMNLGADIAAGLATLNQAIQQALS